VAWGPGDPLPLGLGQVGRVGRASMGAAWVVGQVVGWASMVEVPHSMVVGVVGALGGGTAGGHRGEVGVVVGGTRRQHQQQVVVAAGMAACSSSSSQGGMVEGPLRGMVEGAMGVVGVGGMAAHHRTGVVTGVGGTTSSSKAGLEDPPSSSSSSTTSSRSMLGSCRVPGVAAVAWVAV
jgi:hypothetical protein